MNKNTEHAIFMAEMLGSLSERMSAKGKSTDERTFGYNPKRCKSCEHFSGCHEALNRKPMDRACREYVKRKR